jgi:hypothetical protein
VQALTPRVRFAIAVARRSITPQPKAGSIDRVPQALEVFMRRLVGQNTHNENVPAIPAHELTRSFDCARPGCKGEAAVAVLRKLQHAFRQSF